MATNRKKASKLVKKTLPVDLDIDMSPDTEEEEPEFGKDPGEKNPNFGKVTRSAVNDIIESLLSEEAPVDDTEYDNFEWAGRLIQFPVRQKYKFRAEKSYYRLQLTSHRDWLDPATGQIIQGDNKAAQFTNGRYDTRDTELAKLIYRSKAFQAGRIEDIDDVNRRAKEQNYQALKQVLSSAGDKKRLLRELITEMIEEAAEEVEDLKE